MPQITDSVTVQRPVHDVFEYASDVSRWPEWDRSILEMQVHGDIHVGTRGTMVRRGGPRRIEMTFEITRLEPDQVVAYTSEGGGMQADGEMRFTSDGPTTRIDGRADLTPRGMPRLLMPIMTRVVRGGMHASLPRLKQRVETSPN